MKHVTCDICGGNMKEGHQHLTTFHFQGIAYNLKIYATQQITSAPMRVTDHDICARCLLAKIEEKIR